MIEAQVEAVQGIAGRGITTVTGDAGYAYGKVYAGLERRGVDPVIPAKRERKSRMPLRRFRYDARHDIVKCPQGKILRPQRLYTYGRFYYSKARVCKHCPMKDTCLSEGRLNKAIVIGSESSSRPTQWKGCCRGPAPRPRPRSSACGHGSASGSGSR